MSCIGFWTESQRRRLRLAALDPRPVSLFKSPVMTESKRRRIRLLSLDPRAEIRESAALHSDEESVLNRLAKDGDASVRAAVARNYRCPVKTRERLKRDSDEIVRGWAHWYASDKNADA